MLTVAAAFLRTPKARIKGSGIRSCWPPMSKFWRDLFLVSIHGALAWQLPILPLSLSTPVSVSRNLKITKGITFSTELLLYKGKCWDKRDNGKKIQAPIAYQGNRSAAEETVGAVEDRSLTQELGWSSTQHLIKRCGWNKKKRGKPFSANFILYLNFGEIDRGAFFHASFRIVDFNDDDSWICLKGALLRLKMTSENDPPPHTFLQANDIACLRALIHVLASHIHQRILACNLISLPCCSNWHGCTWNPHIYPPP